MNETKTIKIIPFIIVFGLLFIQPSSAHSQEKYLPNKTDIRQKTLTILQNKCNVCHRHKNRKKVFNSSNMEKYARKIYKQVFIKKRMPKGKKIKLNKEELLTLKKWLKSQLDEGM